MTYDAAQQRLVLTLELNPDLPVWVQWNYNLSPGMDSFIRRFDPELHTWEDSNVPFQSNALNH